MSIEEIKARHERVAKGTTWDFNFTDGQLANKDRGELLKIFDTGMSAYSDLLLNSVREIAELEAQLANVKIEVANRVARGDFIRYQHLQAILEDKP